MSSIQLFVGEFSVAGVANPDWVLGGGQGSGVRGARLAEDVAGVIKGRGWVGPEEEHYCQPWKCTYLFAYEKNCG